MAQTVYVFEGKGVYTTSTTWNRTSTTKQIGVVTYTYYNYYKNISVNGINTTYYAWGSWDTAQGAATITKTSGGVYTGIDKTQSGQPRSAFSCNLIPTNLYTVTATSNGNGSVKPATSVTALHGAKVTLTATPSAHYAFQKWSDDNTSATREITVTADTSLSATFAQSEWRLYAKSANTAQGSVTLTGWTSGSYFASGTTKDATANPAAGYRFTGWHKNSSTNAAYETETAALKLDSADTTYEARFASTARVLSVTTPTPELGTLSVWVNDTARTPSASMSVHEGDRVRILSAPAYNATGGAWSVTGRSPGGVTDYTFTVAKADPATLSCVAAFTLKAAHTLTLAIEHPEKGAVTFMREGVEATAMEPSTVTVYADVTYTLTATVTDRTLDMFRGWYENDVLVSDQLELAFTAERDITLKAVFSERPSYTLEARASDGTIPYTPTNAAYAAGCRTTIGRTPDFTNPDRFLAGNVLVTATCAEGWRVAGWLISNVDQGPGGSASLPGFHDTEFRFELSFNATFTFIFERIPVTVSCSVDTASTGIGTVSCSIVNASEEGVSVTARHGDSVVFTAVLIGDSGSYAFEGWYGADGGKVSGNAEYLAQNVSSDLHLAAKFAARVSVAVSATPGATAANASASADGAAFAWVALGGTCDLEAVGGENAHFSGWHDAADSSTGFSNPLAEIAQSAQITVTRSLSLVARFVSTEENSPHYLAVINWDNNATKENPALGTIVLSGADVPGSGITSLTEAEWRAVFSGRGPMGAEPGAPPQSGNRYFMFDGVKSALITATPAASVGFMRWRRQRLNADGTPLDSAAADAGTSPTLNFTSNSHYILYADWGEPAPVNVSVLYAQGSDATMGGFTMSPATPKAQTIQNGIRDTYIQGAEITLDAYVRNGFLFAGWFYDAAGTQPVTLSAENTFTVHATVTLYAKFAQDANAIYLWSGGGENKMMEWRGMRVAFDRPVNMSTARVDAAGYQQVTLQLYAASSPDAPSPDRPTVSVAIRNQNGMRLPMARPERYLEVGIRSSHAVTGFAVSTSMEGLR